MADQVALQDANGKELKFWMHPIGTNYKPEAGVYAFARDDGEVLTILYVGQTDNLSRRLYTDLEDHEALSCVRHKNGDILLTLIVSGGKQARLDLETHLRKTFDPPCNRQ